MSGLSLMEVQRSLHTKLSGDAVLMGLISGVYDAVPQHAVMPYLVIGDGTCSAMPAEGITLSQLHLQLEVWALASGRKTVLTILNRLHALLHFGTLTLNGYQLVMLHCMQSETEIMEDASFIRGRLLVRISVADV